jgi:hypothetical protein
MDKLAELLLKPNPNEEFVVSRFLEGLVYFVFPPEY